MSENMHAEGTADWGVDTDLIEFIQTQVQPGMVTLETGAGLSTLEFVAAGATHTAVTPAKAEIDRIRAEGRRLGLDIDRCTFVEGFSQDVLPELSGPLDLVLIDGGHGFPIPQVDWAYTAPRLRVGGMLVIDDVDLWTGRILVDFLAREPGWRLHRRLGGRTAIFEATQACRLNEWTDQPWVRMRSRWPQFRRKLTNAACLLGRGDLQRLRDKYRHDRRLRTSRQS